MIKYVLIILLCVYIITKIKKNLSFIGIIIFIGYAHIFIIGSVFFMFYLLPFDSFSNAVIGLFLGILLLIGHSKQINNNKFIWQK
ncbi:hypothetical protein [Aliarcobacter butzleri]|uniref:hypothetical protein n=1 Tax=Aliarcobacter butzleri TaxID=28197 RepID=UPI00126A4F3F|nr:hypothetical protein [Aliarcobacter butzleri]